MFLLPTRKSPPFTYFSIVRNNKYDLQLYGCHGALKLSVPSTPAAPPGCQSSLSLDDGGIYCNFLFIACILINQRVIIHRTAVYASLNYETAGLQPLRFAGNRPGWEGGERNMSGCQGGFSIWYECRATLKGQADWQCTDFSVRRFEVSCPALCSFCSVYNGGKFLLLL